MKELSLFLLDIAKNAVTAGASLIQIDLVEDGAALKLCIRDNGCGMTPEFLARVTDPFTTTRTTRKVGMGLPLLKMTAELTGGSFEISSKPGVGTRVMAVFAAQSIDTPPVGDLAASLVTLIQGSPDRDFIYTRQRGGSGFQLDTREIRALMEGIPLDAPEVLAWLGGYLTEQEDGLSAHKSEQS